MILTFVSESTTDIKRGHILCLVLEVAWMHEDPRDLVEIKEGRGVERRIDGV